MKINKKYIVRNLIAAPAVLLLWHFGLSNLWCYEWTVGDMLPNNVKFISQHSSASIPQRWEFKLGAAYNYLTFVRDNTPPNAVILYPTQSAFFPQGVESIFKSTEPYNKLWATRFLYPRKLILRDEFENSPYAKLVTHVAIVNGIGYDVFPPQHMPAEKLDFTIIQISGK